MDPEQTIWEHIQVIYSNLYEQIKYSSGMVQFTFTAIFLWEQREKNKFGNKDLYGLGNQGAFETCLRSTPHSVGEASRAAG